MLIAAPLKIMWLLYSLRTTYTIHSLSYDTMKESVNKINIKNTAKYTYNGLLLQQAGCLVVGGLTGASCSCAAAVFPRRRSGGVALVLSLVLSLLPLPPHIL